MPTRRPLRRRRRARAGGGGGGDVWAWCVCVGPPGSRDQGSGGARGTRGEGPAGGGSRLTAHLWNIYARLSDRDAGGFVMWLCRG